jgi:hypothetical protein
LRPARDGVRRDDGRGAGRDGGGSELNPQPRKEAGLFAEFLANLVISWFIFAFYYFLRARAALILILGLVVIFYFTAPVVSLLFLSRRINAVPFAPGTIMEQLYRGAKRADELEESAAKKRNAPSGSPEPLRLPDELYVNAK